MIVDGELAVLAFAVAAPAGAGQGFLCRHQHGAFLDLIDARRALGRALDLEVEVDLAAQAQRYRVHGGQVSRIPVSRFTHRVDGRFGGADQTHDLRVLELGVVAHQPLDGVGPLVAARNRRVTGAFALGRGDANLGLAQLHAVTGVGLGLFDLFTGQLAVLDRVDAHDAAGDVTIGNALNFERVQRTECGDLLE